jgi:hypothetical protein
MCSSIWIGEMVRVGLCNWPAGTNWGAQQRQYGPLLFPRSRNPALCPLSARNIWDSHVAHAAQLDSLAASCNDKGRVWTAVGRPNLLCCAVPGGVANTAGSCHSHDCRCCFLCPHGSRPKACATADGGGVGRCWQTICGSSQFGPSIVQHSRGGGSSCNHAAVPDSCNNKGWTAAGQPSGCAVS